MEDPSSSTGDELNGYESVRFDVLFSIPPNELAGWSMIGLCLFMALYWVLDARHRFRGPTRSDEVELRKVEAALGG